MGVVGWCSLRSGNAMQSGFIHPAQRAWRRADSGRAGRGVDGMARERRVWGGRPFFFSFSIQQRMSSLHKAISLNVSFLSTHTHTHTTGPLEQTSHPHELIRVVPLKKGQARAVIFAQDLYNGMNINARNGPEQLHHAARNGPDAVILRIGMQNEMARAMHTRLNPDLIARSCNMQGKLDHWSLRSTTRGARDDFLAFLLSETPSTGGRCCRSAYRSRCMYE